jgi:3-oxoacyl-[acyl-carrier-protein] synthase-3
MSVSPICLTYCSLIVKWGERVTPLGVSDAALRPCTKTAPEMVNESREVHDAHGRSLAGLMSPEFVEASLAAH